MAAANLIDLTGKRFGRWTVIKRVPKAACKPMWLCRCTCKTQRVINGCTLRCGHSTSCGCYRSERMSAANKANIKHGYAKRNQRHPLYKLWSGMIQRCEYKKHVSYKDYGGRGITVCARWRNSFQAFLDDMGERPKGTTLDRNDNNKGYNKANCRWATHSEQSANRRRAA